MLSHQLVAGAFPRGTICAGIGLLVVAAYYARAWSDLRDGPEMYVSPAVPEISRTQPWPELRRLQLGILLTVLFVLLAGAADADPDWLSRLAGGLMGLCGAFFFAMFAVGFVALANLWKELLWQFKKAKVRSLLFSIPLAIVWLGLGLGIILLLGKFVGSSSVWWEVLIIALMWHLIGEMFHGLWKGRSHAALMLRLILLGFFSAIIITAAVFGFMWGASLTAPLLVTLASVMGTFNVFFYSHWVRPRAVEDDLVGPPGGAPFDL